MDQPREVVVTGVGVVSPIGNGRQAFQHSLDHGTSGVRPISAFVNSPDVPYQFGGQIQNYDAKEYVQPRKTLKVMSVEIQAAYGAAVLAMQDAGLAKGAVTPTRFGVVLGSEMLYGDLNEMTDIFVKCTPDGEFHFDRWGEVVFKDLFPLWMLKYLPNMAACHIGIAHDARGPTNSIVEGTVSSLLAFAEAVSVIQRGSADVMLTGGSGSRMSLGAMPFRAGIDLTEWHGDPAKASRPFDASHSGMVPGEGCGVLVLEAREHALARGAKILARVGAVTRGFESPQKPGGQQGTAIRAGMKLALDRAGVSRDDIDHVNAHGNSIVRDDRLEAAAIRDVLGDVPVTAPKSFFGDTGAGSGALELAASVLALAEGRVPRTLNYEQPDPGCPVNVIHGESKPVTKSAVLKLNQADTGHAAAVLLTRE